jgi:hypothetical protein
MNEFFIKYVDTDTNKYLISLGIPAGSLSNVKYERCLPGPVLLLRILNGICEYKKLDFNELLWEAVCTITGDNHVQ